MCFKRYKPKKRIENKKRIYPTIPAREFSIDEIILCNGCKNYKSLSDIKIHCRDCNQFYCCKIAGTCIGKNCINNIHNLSLCIYCVPKLPINIEKNNRYDQCICKLCI